MSKTLTLLIYNLQKRQLLVVTAHIVHLGRILALGLIRKIDFKLSICLSVPWLVSKHYCCTLYTTGLVLGSV